MIQCKNCKIVFDSKINFCSTCGAEITSKKSTTLDTIIAFYITIIVFIGISYYVFKAYDNSFWSEVLIESIFIIIVVGYSIFDLKNITPLYKLPKINKWYLNLFILFTIINAFIVYYITGFINTLTNNFSNNYYEDYLYLENPLLWSIIFIAILPPIFEELAFRGFLFNLLNKIVSKKSTIIATSFLFALVHFSFISLIWIFPFGLFLGYLRSKYKSLWIPMIIHFIHNFIILMIDYTVFNM
ncbi:CPBP family intramembrane glutamic endopeptidase [Tenacibaculum ovolyticum]|uniref:CPBP family intramembrane glutamic endopeptidase n=1 Tax=Tenacibaculum ovolyticum TaxID=104270 RepID=UPI0004283E0F|nr:type II CAAX endopeptidase family protein [Tenacibaculum ovolyticum]